MAGPVVIPLGAAYKTKGCQAAKKSLFEAIETNPNRYYVTQRGVPGRRAPRQLVAGMEA